MHRLTTVTTLRLIGTTVTGYLGMNLIAEAEAPFNYKVLFFSEVLLGTLVLTLLTIMFSKRLSGLFDWLSGERN